ncbi:MAG: 8-oxo-dGTP diphosphatase MutT [Woeseia sp.]
MRIEVAAAILRDRDGRVLLAERQNDPQFNGLWEFPGGKTEPSETPEMALRRELAEELGIEITTFERFVSLDHDYRLGSADRLVRIDFFLVTEWRSQVRAMNGQALRWVLPAEIKKNEMMPANIAVVDALCR